MTDKKRIQSTQGVGFKNIIRILILLVILSFWFISPCSAGSISGVFEDSEIVKTLKNDCGFGFSMYKEELMREVLNSDPDLRDQLVSLNKEIQEYYSVVNTSLPKFDTSLMDSTDDVGSVKKVSEWICTGQDLLAKFLPPTPLKAACYVQELIDRTEQVRDTLFIPSYAQEIYDLYVIKRKSGEVPANALDNSIYEIKDLGGYNIFTSQDAYKGLTNEEVVKKVRDKFEKRYQYELMVSLKKDLTNNKDKYIKQIRDKYRNSLNKFTVIYNERYFSCQQNFDSLNSDISQLEDDIDTYNQELEGICEEYQNEIENEMTSLESDLNTIISESELIVCDVSNTESQNQDAFSSLRIKLQEVKDHLVQLSSTLPPDDTCPVPCEDGEYRNKKTQKCEKLCFDGSIPESDGSCPVIECEGGLVYDSTSESCICPDGTMPDNEGKCCKESEVLNSFGECESICDGVFKIWDDTKKDCVDKLCPDGNPVPPGGCLPTCDDDEYWDGESCVKKCQTGGLVYDKETDGCVPPQCGSKKYWNANAERCECTGEYTEDSSGNCISDPPVEDNPDLISEFINEIDQLQTIKDTTKIESNPTSTMINGLTSIEIFGILLTYNDSDGLYHGSKDGHNVEFDPTSFIIEDVTAGGEMDVSKSDILYPETGDTSENKYEPSENTDRDDVDEPVYQEPEEEYENEEPTYSEPEVEPQEPDNSNVEEETPSTVDGPTCDHPYYCDESLWPDISSSESYVWTVINGQTGIAIWNSKTETSRYYVWVPGGWVQTTREGDAV